MRMKLTKRGTSAGDSLTSLRRAWQLMRGRYAARVLTHCPPSLPSSGKGTMTDRASEVTYALQDAWNARDLPRFLSYLSEDVEWYDLGMPYPPAIGREAVRRFAESILRAFPDFQYRIQPPLCVAPDGSRCAAVWEIAATHQAVLDPPGFAPTGRSVTMQGVDVLEFRGGQVCRIRTLFDPLDAAGQLLGLQLRPPPGSFRERVAVWVQRLLAGWVRRRSPSAAA